MSFPVVLHRRYKMSNKFTRILAVFLLLFLLLPLGRPAFADESGEEPPAFEDMRIYLDGLLTGRGYRFAGVAYLPLEDLCRFFGEELNVYHDDTEGAYRISSPSLEISAPDGMEYICANQRYLYAPGGLAEINGELCLPAITAAKLFHLGCSVAEDLSFVQLDSSEVSILRGTSTYYSDTFGNEEIFWLSRIIHAEAGNQPMAGRIGVGNVVLNRVASEIYPNTVYQVIFDNNVVYQFEPVLRGTVYSEPDELSVIAAYLAFEGFNTVGESMYFLNPSLADDTWFRESLTYTVTIGDHDFYS